jgi:pimeloyl-ACP methyl ester carboxylesterase
LDLFDSHERLGGITSPTLILHGDEDIMVAPHFALELQDRIRGAEIEWVPGSGHIVPAEKCCPQVLKFLDRNPL